MKTTFKITIHFFVISLFLFSCQQKVEKENTKDAEKIKVAVFNGNGASKVCVMETVEALKMDSGIAVIEISAVEIMLGELNELDVIVFPGGSGSKEFNNIGLLAAGKIQEFAKKKGNGVVGICAGGYLLASTPNYASLKMLPVHSIREYYNRGRGLISFKTTDQGDKVFPELKAMKNAFVQYYDGPMYENIDSSKFTVLATINTDIATKEGYPKGVSINKPAFGISNYGEGRVIMTTGHPEATSGMRWMVPRMARWAANKELISYNTDLVRPLKYNHEVLYYPETNKLEKEYFWKLSSDNEEEIIQAIDGLHSIYSRTSIRWSQGLLRHTSSAVRLKAAQYLLETEYTHAIKDVEVAYKLETDEVVKKEMEIILKKLKSFIP